MPNHVTNKLFLKGSEGDIKRLVEIVGGDGEAFNVNRFFPMPEKLKATSSPARIISDDEYSDWLKRKKSGKLTPYEEMSNGPLTQEMSDNLKRVYGHDNWYDWALDNWGSKWGSYDSEYDEELGVFTFLSAWDPPARAIMRLSKLFPHVELKLHYADEAFGYNTGECIFKAGRLVSQYTPETGIDSYIFAMTINGDEDYCKSRLNMYDPDMDKIDDEFIMFCIILAHKKDYEFDIKVYVYNEQQDAILIYVFKQC